MSFSCFLAETSISYAFSNSDFVGQMICVILILFSIATWTFMLAKGSAIKKAEKLNNEFLRKFRERRNPLALVNTSITECGPIASIYFAAREKIEAFHITAPGVPRRALNDSELELVDNSIGQAVEEEIDRVSDKMIFLSTAVSGSPFLGLFGTVWGITIAFTQLAQQGRADIQTLAPGVSGALLTTVIALIVAIPSLIGMNFLNSKIKSMVIKLDSFREEFISRLKIEQMDSYNAASSDSAR